jgi:hypothetical protein
MSEIPKLGTPYANAAGFPGLVFKDSYENNCHVQMSSVCHGYPPGQSALWLGVDGHAMHLDREQVVALMYELDSWIREGIFLH